MAGDHGAAPRFAGSEPAVLLLNESPMKLVPDASDRTGDLSLTGGLHYHCANPAKWGETGDRTLVSSFTVRRPTTGRVPPKSAGAAGHDPALSALSRRPHGGPSPSLTALARFAGECINDLPTDQFEFASGIYTPSDHRGPRLPA